MTESHFLPPWLGAGKDGTLLLVRVQPRARQNKIAGATATALKVAVTAAPVEGQANRQLCKYLAKALGIASRDLEVVGGRRSRDKRVVIRGLDAAEVNRRLATLLTSDNGG